ncbi:MAG TPA: hypothetical protein PK516_02595 [Sedimentibacter sp.]|jgi:hypothetical protein|nr:hypothetical protein [Sedimentibacter sp.]NLA13049.1 hypothetical protein [Tissierellia bacterium]HOT21936.1 hypothetical protein [Sedimentibacter sp.]HPB78937.1 hypothetical protein [Sedimentibacter sp.]HPY56403.1 hypothetical protein [Sedimentibacter sp.]
MNNNYKIIRTIYENAFQRILECKDDDTGAIFYSNIITSKKVINLININDLKKIKSNILECYNTEDRIYIFTKSLETDCRKLTDLANSNLTMKQQFNLAEKSINLASNIYNMTDVVQQKILDIDRLFIDDNNDLIVDCNLIFEQEYDIADNETFKRLGNIIHMIFSGIEIIDYNISDSIPPDILKIIVRCLTREYVFPNDALVELKRSPIFNMLFGEEIINNTVDIEQPEEPSLVIHNEESDDYLNIYLEDNQPAKKKALINKDIKRAAVSLLTVVMVLLLGNFIIKKFNKNDEAEAINNVKPPLQEAPSETPVEEEPVYESTDIHFSEELLESIGYEGAKAQKDTDIYVEGSSSLTVANSGQDKVKALFAAVDFKDDNFNYMLMKQIGVSGKIKSQYDTQARVVFEAYKDGVIKSNFHSLVNIYDDIWSQFTVPINVTEADVLYIYLEYEGENKVWIDSLFIDVIK